MTQETIFAFSGTIEGKQLEDIEIATGLDPKRVMLAKAFEKAVEQMNKFDNIIGMEFDLRVTVQLREEILDGPENNKNEHH
jgi:hypothetical protein